MGADSREIGTRSRPIEGPFVAESQRERIRTARSIVVKVGTGVLTRRDGRLSGRAVGRIARQVFRAARAGRKVVLVSSAAIQAGVGALRLAGRPKRMPELQAAAAVGQVHLMRCWEKAFTVLGGHVGQVLLTANDLEDRAAFLNVRNTITALQDMGVVPVINENDTVATEEIGYRDNDTLAALVTNMLSADLLVLMTVEDGLLDGERVVDVVEAGDRSVVSLAGRSVSRFGSGGMRSKLEAAAVACGAGEAAVICNGRRDGILDAVLAGEPVGTLLMPARRKLRSRQRWIGSGVRPSGRLQVDDGAARALLERNTSLLPAGITRVAGRFARGDVVAIVDAGGREIARGLVNYSAEEVTRIAGQRSGGIAALLGSCPYDEVVHRDNLVRRD
jgi:glutamate 5-kinase